jgi:hypothetical protein
VRVYNTYRKKGMEAVKKKEGERKEVQIIGPETL